MRIVFAESSGKLQSGLAAQVSDLRGRVVRPSRPPKALLPFLENLPGLFVFLYLRQQIDLDGHLRCRRAYLTKSFIVVRVGCGQGAEYLAGPVVFAQFPVAAGLFNTERIAAQPSIVLPEVMGELGPRLAEQSLVLPAARLVGLGKVVVRLRQGEAGQHHLGHQLVALLDQSGVVPVNFVEALFFLDQSGVDLYERLLRLSEHCSCPFQPPPSLGRRFTRPTRLLDQRLSTLDFQVREVPARAIGQRMLGVIGEEFFEVFAGFVELLLTLLQRQLSSAADQRNAELIVERLPKILVGFRAVAQ